MSRPVTFADAAETWLLHGERERKLSRSTVADYRQALDAYLLAAVPEKSRPETAHGRPPFASTPLGEIRSDQLKEWYETLPPGRTADKLLMIVTAVLGHARSRGWTDGSPPAEPDPGQPAEPDLDPHAVPDPDNHRDPGASGEREGARAGECDLYSREEIDALVRAAANDQDAAIFTCAAMTGLRRRELVELRWRDIDFADRSIRVPANFSHGELVTPKRGKVRSLPMVPEVAQALARLAERDAFTGNHEPVFADTAGGQLEASAVRRRYSRAAQRAGLRPLPFASLRHHFGSVAVTRAPLVEVQSWMGHAEIQTTARYLQVERS